MDTWLIIVLVAIALLTVILWYRHKHKAPLTAPKPTLGMQGVSAVEKVPIVGTYVSAVSLVAKPINHTLDKVNQDISSGLKHIPIVGGVLAKPNELLGSGIKKLNQWIGFD